MFRIMVV